MIASMEKARHIFKRHGGTLRTSEAIAEGIHPRTLYALRDAGELDQPARGLFRLASLPFPSEPDLVTVAKRIPHGVVCLMSALAYHDLTTQVPHEVHLALPRTARHPRLAYPPLRIYRFSREAFNAGVDTRLIDRVPVRVYSPEKTLADCFKYRNKIGLDVALEALRAYAQRRGARLAKVLECARVCRVDQVIRPYLEAVAR